MENVLTLSKFSDSGPMSKFSDSGPIVNLWIRHVCFYIYYFQSLNAYLRLISMHTCDNVFHDFGLCTNLPAASNKIKSKSKIPFYCRQRPLCINVGLATSWVIIITVSFVCFREELDRDLDASMSTTMKVGAFADPCDKTDVDERFIIPDTPFASLIDRPRKKSPPSRVCILQLNVVGTRRGRQ